MSLVGSTMVGKYRLYCEPLLSASECLSFRLSFVATMYSYLDRGKPGANKLPYPLTLVCHSYPSRLFFSSLYTSLKRVRFFSILQTHYGCLCQQCNQSEHLSLARQKTCPPRGLLFYNAGKCSSTSKSYWNYHWIAQVIILLFFSFCWECRASCYLII